MKKKLLIVVGAFVLVIASGVGIYQTNASNQSPKLSIDDVKNQVIAQYPGEITEIELDREHNREIYEIELVYEGMEYEFKIDANTGEVIKLKEKSLHVQNEKKTNEKKENREKLDVIENDQGKQMDQSATNKNDNQDQKNQSKNSTTTNDKQEQQQKGQDKKTTSKNNHEKTVISMEKAIQIALSEFPGKVHEAELDRDDGRLIYEIEIKGNGEEADFDIDAYTGEIISIEIEEDD